MFQGHQIKSDTTEPAEFVKAAAEKIANNSNEITDHCVGVSNSSRIIGVQGDSNIVQQNKADPVETYDSLEPVKPPRLKKMARLQKMEQEKIGNIIKKKIKYF